MRRATSLFHGLILGAVLENCFLEVFLGKTLLVPIQTIQHLFSPSTVTHLDCGALFTSQIR